MTTFTPRRAHIEALEALLQCAPSYPWPTWRADHDRLGIVGVVHPRDGQRVEVRAYVSDGSWVLVGNEAPSAPKASAEASEWLRRRLAQCGACPALPVERFAEEILPSALLGTASSILSTVPRILETPRQKRSAVYATILLRHWCALRNYDDTQAVYEVCGLLLRIGSLDAFQLAADLANAALRGKTSGIPLRRDLRRLYDVRRIAEQRRVTEEQRYAMAYALEGVEGVDAYDVRPGRLLGGDGVYSDAEASFYDDRGAEHTVAMVRGAWRIFGPDGEVYSQSLAKGVCAGSRVVYPHTWYK